MKKFLAVAGILLVLVGGGLVLGGFAVNGFKGFAPEYTEKEYVSDASEIRNVAVKLATVSLKVRIGERLRLVYPEREDSKFEISEADGTLSIGETAVKGRRPWIWNLGPKIPAAELTLPCAPENFSFQGGEDQRATGLELTGKFGAVVFENVVNGGLSIRDAELRSLRAETVNGAFELRNTLVADGVSISSGSGAVELQNVTGTTISAELTNGASRFDSVKAEVLNVNLINGAIAFDRLDVKKSVFSTVNGAISGTVVGKASDYTLLLDAVNGSVSPGDRTAVGENARELRANTVNGKIEIRFTGATEDL